MRQLKFADFDPSPELPLPPGIASPRLSSVDRFRAWQGHAAIAMARLDSDLSANKSITSEAFGARWSRVLRCYCPAPHQAAKISAALNADERTARAWLAGQAPAAHRVAQAVAVWGVGVLRHLYPEAANDAGAQAVLDNFAATLARLRQELEL